MEAYSALPTLHGTIDFYGLPSDDILKCSQGDWMNVGEFAMISNRCPKSLHDKSDGM